jgi:hypothetical protein
MIDHSRDSHGEKTECKRKGVRGKTRRRLEIQRLASKGVIGEKKTPSWFPQY